MTRALRVSLVAASLSLWVSTSHANDPAGAEVLFEAGQAALEKSDFETACRKFKQSYALEPAPGTLYFQGDCEERRGRIATAWSLFTDLLHMLPDSDPKHQGVADRIAALAPRLPKLTVHLAPGSPPDTRVSKDKALLPVDTAIPVDPGEQLLVIEAEGHAPVEKRITVAEGAAAEVTVEVGKALPKPLKKQEASGGVQVPVGITIGSIGVAAVLAGIGVGIAAKVQYDKSEEYCQEDACLPEGVSIRNSARVKGTASTVVFFVGVAAVATGAIVWLTAPKSEGGLMGSAPLRVGVGLNGLVLKTSW